MVISHWIDFCCEIHRYYSISRIPLKINAVGDEVGLAVRDVVSELFYIRR